MKQKHTIYFCLTIFMAIILNCASNLKQYPNTSIDIKYERITLNPFENIALCREQQFWPTTYMSEKMLLDALLGIWSNILSEFRRCERFGFYTVVDSTHFATVYITPRISKINFDNDTLSIEVTVQTKFNNGKFVTPFSIKHLAVAENIPSDTSSTLYKLLPAFKQLKRDFLYSDAVKPFFPQQDTL